MKPEIEIKLIIEDKNDVRKKLESIGAKKSYDEMLIKQKTFDFVNVTLPEGEFKWLRVRDTGGEITITLKHIKDDTKIDGIMEVEIESNDFESSCNLMLAMGLEETNYQEKFREKWMFEDIEIVIDTWPGLKPYIEIEADSEEKVIKVTELLGFDYSKGIIGSADYMYLHQLNLPLEALKQIKTLTFESCNDALGEWLK